MMNRRGFLSSLGAACFAPAAAIAGQEEAHPFAALINPDTGASFSNNAARFTLAAFMTPGEINKDCGGTFGGLHQTHRYMQRPDLVELIIVMPKFLDQIEATNLDNLKRAKADGFNFTILTGDLPAILAASGKVGDDIFTLNSAGKISDHTLNAYFLTPGGKTIFNHRADDHITMPDLADRAMSRCENLLYRHLCR